MKKKIIVNDNSKGYSVSDDGVLMHDCVFRPREIEIELNEDGSISAPQYIQTDIGYTVYPQQFRKFHKLDENAILPTRATYRSAGYDLYVPNDFEKTLISPGETIRIATNIACEMHYDEFLAVVVRSSVGIKKKLMLENQMGVIDSDYYNNPDTKGNIFICLKNVGNLPVVIYPGERIAQGIFMKYYITDDDQPVSENRTGGIGSTNNN